MILDHLENCRRYLSLNAGFERAFRFLADPETPNLKPGKYELDGERLFAIVVNGPGQERADGVLETHEKYIDIQYVVAGVDDMAWKPRSKCVDPADDYDPETDARNYRDAPDSWFSVRPGSFALFFPEDAHMAMFAAGTIHKVILKVADARG